MLPTCQVLWFPCIFQGRPLVFDVGPAVAAVNGGHCAAVSLWLIHNYSVKEFDGGGIGLLFKYSGKTLAG